MCRPDRQTDAKHRRHLGEEKENQEFPEQAAERQTR
jgi:hypothetical protein